MHNLQVFRKWSADPARKSPPSEDSEAPSEPRLFREASEPAPPPGKDWSPSDCLQGSGHPAL